MDTIGITTYHLDKSNKALQSTIKCIKSIQKSKMSIQIILIDYGSGNIIDELSRNYNIKVIHQDTNSLFKAWNTICKIAFVENNRVIIINNDIIFELPTLKSRHDEEFASAGVSGKLFEDNSLENLIKYANENPNHNFVTVRQKDTNKSCLPFSAFLMQKLLYDKLGPFDEKFVYALGDIDFKIRMMQAQEPYYVCSECIVQHEEHMSSNILSKNELRKIIANDTLYFMNKIKLNPWMHKYYIELLKAKQII